MRKWVAAVTATALRDLGARGWLYPTGLLSFDGIEFVCEVDHAGSYLLRREAEPAGSID